MSEGQVVPQRRLLRAAAAATFLSAGVVAIEHFSHELTGAMHGEVAHVLRDGLLGAPLAFVALVLAARLARRGEADRSPGRQLFVQAAATSMLFGVLLVPGALVHERIDAALADAPPAHVAADGHSHAHTASPSQLPHALRHGSRVTWTGLPFAAIAVVIRRGRPRRANHDANQKLGRAALAAVLSAGLVAGGDHIAAADSAGVVAAAVATNCNEVGAVIPLSAERVRPHVPPEFKLAGAERPEVAGQVDVFVRAYRCDRQTLGNETVLDTTSVTFGAFIEDPDGSPAVYTFEYLTDNPHLAPWMKSSTGMDRIHFVPGLSMKRNGIGPAATYEIVSPGPSPAPFRMTATTPPAAPVGFALTGRWWSELPRSASGRPAYFRFTNDIPAYRLAGGTAELYVPPGTFMAELFGATQVTAYSVGGDFDRQETRWSVLSAPPAV